MKQNRAAQEKIIKMSVVKTSEYCNLEKNTQPFTVTDLLFRKNKIIELTVSRRLEIELTVSRRLQIFFAQHNCFEFFQIKSESEQFQSI